MYLPYNGTHLFIQVNQIVKGTYINLNRNLNEETYPNIATDII